MIDSEENYESPLGNSRDKLEIVQTLIQRVENPAVALTPQEVVELLLDFGLMLRQSTDSYHQNPEVFEDPLDRTDSLGNIRMIHRKVSKRETGLLEKLGDAVCDLAHEYLLRQRGQERLDERFSRADFLLGDWDLSSTEELLDAKEKLIDLRRENNRLDSRNERLFLQLAKTRNKLGILRKKTTQISSPMKSKGTNSSSDYMSEMKSLLPRSLEKNKNSEPFESQLDSITWDETVNGKAIQT